MARARAVSVRAEVTEHFVVTCPFCEMGIALEVQRVLRRGWRRLLPLQRPPVFACPACQAILDPSLPRGRFITGLKLNNRPKPVTDGGPVLTPPRTVVEGAAVENPPPVWEAETDIMAYRRRRRGSEPLTPPQIQFRERVIQSLKGGELKVPVLPHVAAELSRIFRGSEVNVNRVIEVIQTDLMISATLLKLANSALYRGDRPCLTVKEAVERLGFTQVEAVVYSVTMSCKVLRQIGYGYDARRLHRHALGVAALSRLLARRVGIDDGQAFMAGILHDIGKVVILDACRAAERAGGREGNERVVHELMDLHHARLGGVLCRRWDLPPFLQQALPHHHDLVLEPGVEPIAAVLNLADNLAHVAGVGVPPIRIRALDHPALKSLELPARVVEEVLEEFSAVSPELEGLAQLV